MIAGGETMGSFGRVFLVGIVVGIAVWFFNLMISDDNEQVRSDSLVDRIRANGA